MGKGKVLKTTISLLGKVDPSLKTALSKAQKQSDDTGKSMVKSMKNAGAAMTKGMKNTGTVMTKTVKGFAKTAIAAFAGIAAAARLKEFAQQCITEAKEAIDVETKLGALLQNVTKIQIRGPNAAADAASELIKVGDQLERSGVVAGDVMVAGFQQLASFQLDDVDITTLSEGMADLLAQTKGLNATQSDAVSVANMIGKVMTGSVGALTRVGIIFDENQEKVLKMGNAEEKVAMLAEVLKQNVGGVNRALAETDQGKMVVAENAIGAIRDEIGRKLLPIIANLAVKSVPLVENAFNKVGEVVDKVSPHIQNMISTAIPLAEKAFAVVSGTLDEVAPVAEEMFSFIIDSARQLSPVFTSVGQSITDGLGGQLPDIMTVMQTLFGYIRQGMPTIISIVGVVATALSPVVSALISVARMLLPKIISLIQNLAPLFQSLSPILGVIGSLFSTVFRAAAVLISDLTDSIASIITCLTGVIEYLNTFFAGGWVNVWERIKATFSSVWSSIKSIARSALSAIISPINNIISGINKVSSVVGIQAIPNIAVPQFAEGATVNRPTLAVVGEGSDPETIVPHNNKPRSRRLLANAAAGVGMKFGKGNSYTYAPVIYASNAKGVQEVLDSDFERFKSYMDRCLDDNDREVFA